MTARTEKHEQMPNEVAVAQTFVHEKEHASGIGDATGYQPEKCGERNRQRDRTNRDQRQPAGAEIKRHPSFGWREAPRVAFKITPKMASAQTSARMVEPHNPRSGPSVNGVYVPAINKKIAE